MHAMKKGVEWTPYSKGCQHINTQRPTTYLHSDKDLATPLASQFHFRHEIVTPWGSQFHFRNEIVPPWGPQIHFGHEIVPL